MRLPRSPRLLLGALALGLLLGALALALVAYSGGSDETQPTASTRAAEGTTTTLPPIEVAVKLGRTKIVGAGVPAASPAELDPTTAKAVVAAVNAYVEAGFVAPLRNQTPAELDDLLALGAFARLAAGEHDRTVLTTEGLPEVRTATLRLAPVDLTGLTEGFGSLPLVSARIEFVAKLHTIDGPLTVTNLGELMLSDDGDGWRVVGYEMAVVRDDGTRATTTTAVSAP